VQPYQLTTTAADQLGSFLDGVRKLAQQLSPFAAGKPSVSASPLHLVKEIQ
jgi:hypothetical protein